MSKNIIISEENKDLLLSLDGESIKVIITNLFKANNNEKVEIENVLLESIFKVFLKELKIPKSLSDLGELAKFQSQKKKLLYRVSMNFMTLFLLFLKLHNVCHS